MIGIIGIVIIFGMVFGGYLSSGGKMAIIVKSLPHELIIIGGAAVGAFTISNDMSAIKLALRDIAKVFKGPHWKPADYRDLLCLLFELIRVARQSPVALEEHIAAPESSVIFGRYTKIQADHEAVGHEAGRARRACQEAEAGGTAALRYDARADLDGAPAGGVPRRHRCSAQT